MCGIAGIINFQHEPIDVEELNLFTDALAHRGPDGRGIYVKNYIGLGHRRLAILDLNENANCPMSFGTDERYWITYNGEIYNFIELQNFLKTKGYCFKTETDTEVVLAAYDFWQENCLYKFNGMWAFAIWDSQEEKLFISRDRFGIKPLYFLSHNNIFYFASELKAFCALKHFSVQINESIVPVILQSPQQYEGTYTDTILNNVKRLLPGHYMTFTREGKCKIHKWWETKNFLVRIPDSYQKQVEQFQELFLDSVRLRMRSDVPLATSLSGGLDSTSVACSAYWITTKSSEAELTRCNPDWRTSFVAIHPESALDEKQYADIVIKHISSKPIYINANNDDAIRLVPYSVWMMDDIYNGIGISAYLVYKAMRNHNIYVTLDGHGADELLGGYPFYLDILYMNINNKLYDDFHSHLLPSILRNFDRCSMASGIEVRMPFMDWRLVTYTFSLPVDAKIGNGFTKRILRDAMNKIIPEQIRLRRSKIGLNSPMIEWFNNGLRPLIYKVINHKYWRNSPFWNAKKLNNIIIDYCQNQKWTYKDWNLILELWTKFNLVIYYILFCEKNKDYFNE